MSDTHDLRAESNQNRINFLRNELSLCFTLVSVAETERNSGNNEHAKASLADAEKGYATVKRVLSDPKHAKHINDQERRELTEGMAEVRRKLDDVTSQL